METEAAALCLSDDEQCLFSCYGCSTFEETGCIHNAGYGRKNAVGEEFFAVGAFQDL